MGRAARIKRERKADELRMNFHGLIEPTFVASVRESILRREARDSCIVSVRVYQRILARKGVRVDPLTVEVYACNAVMADWLAKYERMPRDEEEMLKLAGDGGRFVTVGARGMPLNPGKWPGHLVALVRAPAGAGPDVLVDISIDQAHRPEKGVIVRGPAIISMRFPDFLSGKGCAMRRDRNTGTLLYYVAHPEDRSWEETPAWTTPLHIVMDGRPL